MRTLRAALLVAAFILASLGTAFAQSADYRDYLTDAELSLANSTIVIDQGRRRAAAVTAIGQDNFYLMMQNGQIILTRNISEIRKLPHLSAEEKKELMDLAIYALDNLIANDWLYFRIRSAQRKYNYIPVTAEDISREDIVKRVASAAGDDEAIRIMTNPPVSTKIRATFRMSPQDFVIRLRQGGVHYITTTRLAMNIDDIVRITDVDLNRLIDYGIDFEYTPLTADSAVIKKVFITIDGRALFYYIFLYVIMIFGVKIRL